MPKYKIVLVENDEDEQFFMKEGFEKSEFFDVLAMLDNGNALMNWLQAHQGALPDVVLSDLNMPGKDGYDILAEMQATPAYRHIPVIITSTSSTQTFIDKCLSSGAADYLVKPESFTEYEHFVKKLHAVITSKHLVG